MPLDDRKDKSVWNIPGFGLAAVVAEGIRFTVAECAI